MEASELDGDRADELYRARYLALVSSYGDLITRFVPTGELTFVSESYCAFAGQQRGDLVGTSIFGQMDPKDVAEVRERLAAISAQSPVTRGENDVRTEDGTLRCIEWVNVGIFNAAGELVEVQSVGRDVTEQRRFQSDLLETQKRLEHLAGHDSLTGVPNRFLFLDRLETALRVAQRERASVALLFLDLNGFKQVNDSFGHHAGDAVLIETAVRMKAVLRDSDTVCRWGGDEFVALLPGTNRVGAEEVASKTHEVFGEPFELSNGQHRLTASVGVAVYPDDGKSAETLVQVADRSMYRAKRASRRG